MHQTKTDQNHGAHIVRACAVAMHMDISEGNFFARICREIAGGQMEHPVSTPAFNPYRKNPSVWTHCLGKKLCVCETSNTVATGAVNMNQKQHASSWHEGLHDIIWHPWMLLVARISVEICDMNPFNRPQALLLLRRGGPSHKSARSVCRTLVDHVQVKHPRKQGQWWTQYDPIKASWLLYALVRTHAFCVYIILYLCDS